MSLSNDKALKSVAEAVNKIMEAEKKAKMDYDKDGKVESPKDEVWGSRLRAAKMAGKLKEEEQPTEEQIDEASYSAKAARAGKDIGKPGKNFAKIAKSAGAKYGSKAAGERVAGAVLNKLRHPKEDIENEGNAFTGALAKTPKGGKFNVGGKEFTDTSSLEEVGGTPMTPKQDRKSTRLNSSHRT